MACPICKVFECAQPGSAACLARAKLAAQPDEMKASILSIAEELAKCASEGTISLLSVSIRMSNGTLRFLGPKSPDPLLTLGLLEAHKARLTVTMMSGGPPSRVVPPL